MSDVKPLERLLVSEVDAAALADVSVSHWRNLNESAACPEPVRLGRSVKWSVDEIRAWVWAGCPKRDIWNERKRLAPSRLSR